MEIPLCHNVAWGDLAWMVQVVPALPLELYGPQGFSVGSGPSTVNAGLVWNCGSQSCQQSRSLGQPALHAPGLSANNYSACVWEQLGAEVVVLSSQS